MDLQTLSYLAVELDRVVNAPETGSYTLSTGEQVKAATESDVKNHLTSRRDFVRGRQFRFPGITNGWVFESTLKDAGFEIVSARSNRNLPCRVIVRIKK